MTTPCRIPIEQAARQLGTTVLATFMQIRHKWLEAEEIDGAWYVSAESLERLRCAGPKQAVHTCRGGCGGCSAKG